MIRVGLIFVLAVLELLILTLTGLKREWCKTFVMPHGVVVDTLYGAAVKKIKVMI